jgi:hypothetical protein
MGTIPIAEEVLRKYNIVVNKTDTMSYTVKANCKEAMIEFAKLHVEAALKAASENADTLKGEVYASKGAINKDSILNSYPLDNIK